MKSLSDSVSSSASSYTWYYVRYSVWYPVQYSARNAVYYSGWDSLNNFTRASVDSLENAIKQHVHEKFI